MAGEVLDWPASPETIDFPLDFLDWLQFALPQKELRFFLQKILQGPSRKKHLFIKGWSKMIGMSDLLVLRKAMVLYNSTWHIVL